MLQHSAATVSSAAVNITAYTSAVGSAADTRKNLTKAHGKIRGSIFLQGNAII